MSAGPILSSDLITAGDLRYMGGPEMALGLKIGKGSRLVASLGYLYFSSMPSNGGSTPGGGITQSPIVGLRFETKQLTLTLPAD